MVDYDKPYQHVPGNTPILVGSGQVVEREAASTSPMGLAGEAARRALVHAGGDELVAALAGAIDTIYVTRMFADSMGFRPCSFGRSDNPPLSVARAIDARPRHCIYGQAGGNEPQSRVIEFARDIASGERSMVLLAGAEAMYNQRSAERAGQVLDWSESFEQTQFSTPLEDRGWGDIPATHQEVSNGMFAPVTYYGLIEQARASAAGLSAEQQRQSMARLLASFAKVAADNPYAQFATTPDEAEILAAEPLNQMYTKRMIAHDSVNLGAALLMCSVATARELGIPSQHWVFLHGAADGLDVCLSEREDPARSAVAEAVLDRAFAQAGKRIDDIGPIDIYSCFPCAVTLVAELLDLPTDGSRALTLTGGLPYFGGPGNNYSMHGVAEMVSQLRQQPEAYGLVTAWGGMVSKCAAGIYSPQPSSVDWSVVDTRVDTSGMPRCAIAAAPDAGVIVSHVVNYSRGEPVQALILAETGQGEHFVATTAPGDDATVATFLAADPRGRAVQVTALDGGALNFTLA
jgi:acetyl-CoA C-acetyltransferase